MTVAAQTNTAGQVVVRPMVAGDVHAVMEVDAAVYPRPWSEALLVDDMNHPSRHHLVAVGGGGDGRDAAICGHASLMSVAGEGTVTTVAVAPQHQRRGIARHLMWALMTHAVDQELAAVTLEVRASSRGAQRLYSQFGFAPTAIRPRYYEPDREDAVIMWASSIQSPEYQQRLRRLDPTASPGETHE